MNTQRLTLITGIIAILAVIGIIVYSRLQTPDTATAVAADLSGDGQPLLGDPDAPVEVIVFEDFKCPACRNFEEGVLPQLEDAYIEPGQVKLRFVNYPIPLGEDSVTAALAAECAFEQNENAFWEYKTVVYRLQGQQNQRWATPSRLTEIAAEYVPDLDTEDLRACIDEERYIDLVNADKAMGVGAGVRGTPSVFVNGVQAENPGFAALSAAIDAALE